jgi:hypothetical protein
MILYSLHTRSFINKKHIDSVFALVGFTLLATLVYHNPGIKSKRIL